MSNYLKGERKTKVSGLRKGGWGSRNATVLHLSRILLFLRENKGYFTITEIKDYCCSGGDYIKSGISFLLKEGFVIKKDRRQYNNRIGAVNVYSIKDLREALGSKTFEQDDSNFAEKLIEELNKTL